MDKIQQLEQDLQYWEKQREVHKPVYWSGSRGSVKRIFDMEDSHLLNVIKNVYGSFIRARDLPFITEFQEYEGVSYEKWLTWLTNEYQFRKALMDLKTEREYQNWSELDNLLKDDVINENRNEFSNSLRDDIIPNMSRNSDYTIDDIPF